MNPTPSKADTLVQEKSQKKIRAMFDEIAPTYDFLNHFLSGGTDIYWRWQTMRKVKANLPKSDARNFGRCHRHGRPCRDALAHSQFRGDWH
jgi:demethylmenaquinone methyltransferase (EC 2.1.1.-)